MIRRRSSCDVNLARAESLIGSKPTVFTVDPVESKSSEGLLNVSDVKQVLARNITAANSRDIEGYLMIRARTLSSCSREA